MKRIFFLSLLMFAVIGLPAATVYAQQPVLEAGCSPEMWGYLQDQATAVRARNKAYERELLHRQQSTLYLTCFDQAMAVSAKLGLIFSDNYYPGPPPANTLVFPDVQYPDWGASQATLGMDLNSVVNPAFNNWLNAPVNPPALFNFLPQWMFLDNQLYPLAMAEDALVNVAIKGFQQGGNPPLSGLYNGEVDAINQIVQQLPTDPLQGLPLGNTQYQLLVNQLQVLVTTIQTTNGGTMSILLGQLKDIISSFTDTCTKVDDLWTELDPKYNTQNAGVFYPPEGEQYWPFTPYYALKDLLGAPGTTPSPPATPDFIQELGNATDSAALKQALNDVGSSRSDLQSLQGNTSPLGYIGHSPLWPIPPTFLPKDNGETYSAQDVINQM